MDNTNHFIRFDQPKILAKENKAIPRMVREAIEIKKHPNFNGEGGWRLSNNWDPIINILNSQVHHTARAKDTKAVMALTLYKLDASPPARAAMMTIEALGLHNVKYVDVNILAKEQFSEAYTKINPQHTVPTLKDGDFVIWDSHAIAAYLVSKYGKDDSLYPTDLKKRAIIDQRLHFDTGILFPAIRGTVTLLLMGNTTVKEENLQQIESAYDFTEKFLDKEWIAGDQFTIADICCVASISSLKAFLPIDSEKYPRLNSWLERCSELEIYEKANAPGVKSFSYFVKSKMA